MKKLIYILIFLFSLLKGYSQNYDLIITHSGDSIACFIDSITDSQIFFEMKYRNERTHTYMDKDVISEIQRGVIDKKLYAFKPGTTVIRGLKSVTYSNTGIHKNSILLANDHIFSLSVSYERIISYDNNFHIALRCGPGYTAESGDDLALLSQASTLFGASKHFLEMGVAYYHNLTYPDAFIIPLLGYRYMGKRGFVYKIYGTILIDVIDHSEWGLVNPGFHMSFGYRFKI